MLVFNLFQRYWKAIWLESTFKKSYQPGIAIHFQSKIMCNGIYSFLRFELVIMFFLLWD